MHVRTQGAWLAASLAGVIVGTSSVAVGRTEKDDTGPPLVVAVDMGPGGGADVGQVRGVIGRELGRPIVAFVDGPPMAPDEQDLLLVGLSRERIVMSMRRRLEPTVARSVPAPADAAARLRTIAWLAGNVVRDQVSPFLHASAELGKGAPRIDAAAVSSEAAPPVPPPATTEPPPIAPPPLPAGAAVESLARAAPPAPQRTEAEWSVTVAGGPGVYLRADTGPAFGRSVAFQVELLKHRPDRWIWGAGVDVGPFGAVGAGLAALGGSEWRWDKIRLEASLGLGMESVTLHDVQITVSESSAEVPSSETRVTVSTGYVPYGRAAVTLSRELTPSWDLVLRVGANMAFADTHQNPVMTSSLGLRLNLM